MCSFRGWRAVLLSMRPTCPNGDGRKGLPLGRNGEAIQLFQYGGCGLAVGEGLVFVFPLGRIGKGRPKSAGEDRHSSPDETTMVFDL